MKVIQFFVLNTLDRFIEAAHLQAEVAKVHTFCTEVEVNNTCVKRYLILIRLFNSAKANMAQNLQ